MSTVAITGAAGYVGSAIGRGFRKHGWDVMELGRRSANKYELGGEISVDLTGVDALVHCAWDFSLSKWAEIERVNVQGSVRLLQAAHAAGVRRGVFISSLSCFPGCRSMYGKGKLIVEETARQLGYAVVRPGLVYGDVPGGMMGSLEKSARARVIPLIGDGSYLQYPVHEEDLGELVFALCEQGGTGVFAAAGGEGIAFRELLRRAAARAGNKPFFVPVPWQLIFAGLRVMEAFGMNPPFRSDSLTGFVFQNPHPDFSAAKAVVSFRKYPGGEG